MYMSLCIYSTICYVIIGHIVIHSMGYIAIINVNNDPLVVHKHNIKATHARGSLTHHATKTAIYRKCVCLCAHDKD